MPTHATRLLLRLRWRLLLLRLLRWRLLLLPLLPPLPLLLLPPLPPPELGSVKHRKKLCQ